MQWTRCQFCINKGKGCGIILARESETGECDNYKLNTNKNMRISIKNHFPDLFFAEELGLIKILVNAEAASKETLD